MTGKYIKKLYHGFLTETSIFVISTSNLKHNLDFDFFLAILDSKMYCKLFILYEIVMFSTVHSLYSDLKCLSLTLRTVNSILLFCLFRFKIGLEVTYNKGSFLKQCDLNYLINFLSTPCHLKALMLYIKTQYIRSSWGSISAYYIS